MLIEMVITGHIVEVTQSSDEEEEMIHMFDSVYKNLKIICCMASGILYPPPQKKYKIIIWNGF